jgi:hypothetical protein
MRITREPAILALASGVLLLLPRWRPFGAALGWLLLALYPIVLGLMFAIGLSFSGNGVIMAILALAAGELILIGR